MVMLRYVCMYTLYSGSMSSSISLPVRVRTLELSKGSMSAYLGAEKVSK